MLRKYARVGSLGIKGKVCNPLPDGADVAALALDKSAQRENPFAARKPEQNKATKSGENSTFRKPTIARGQRSPHPAAVESGGPHDGIKRGLLRRTANERSAGGKMAGLYTHPPTASDALWVRGGHQKQ